MQSNSTQQIAVLTENEQRAVLQRFAHLVDSPSTSTERQLNQIREALEAELGLAVGLGDPLVRGGWDPDASQWDRFIFWAARFYARADFEKGERDYKLVVAERMSAARERVLANDEAWLSFLERAFAPPNNVLHHITKTQFLEWCARRDDDGLSALQDFWTEGEPVETRIRTFLSRLPVDGSLGTRGNRAAIPSVLFSGVDPYNLPFFLPTPFITGFEITGFDSGGYADPPSTYLNALNFLDRIMEESSRRGIRLRDRLDAQSVLWTTTRWTPGDWPQTELEQLQRFREGLPPVVPPAPDPDPPQPPSMEDFANNLLLPSESLHEMRELLEHRRQAIFFGPPGTGKTYVALQLAEFLAGSKSRRWLVQFHAAYAYEDFVEGFRPREINGRPGFRLEDGPLKKIAAEARQNPDETYVLIIDEINRANIARVFGELYFLLEYRNEEISLQYSAEPFSLPENLLIIGTMNTADRSIALLDAALRRRFYFIPFFPMEPPIEGLLRRWLERYARNMGWVADVVDRANHLLDYRDGGIGPSYFMRQDLDERWVRLIWKHQIIPYLEEHFFGAPDRLEDFQLDRLKHENSKQASAEGETDGPASTDSE